MPSTVDFLVFKVVQMMSHLVNEVLSGEGFARKQELTTGNYALSGPASLSPSGAVGSSSTSSSPGLSFRGELTSRLTGQDRSTSSAAGRNSMDASPRSSPSHKGQASGLRMTGMRSWIRLMRPFAAVVTIVKVAPDLAGRITPAFP